MTTRTDRAMRCQDSQWLPVSRRAVETRIAGSGLLSEKANPACSVYGGSPGLDWHQTTPRGRPS